MKKRRDDKNNGKVFSYVCISFMMLRFDLYAKYYIGLISNESIRGTNADKSRKIEEDAKLNNQKLKVARDGNSHEHMLNETETTLRFGLFMLALMYFRAMTYLKREKKSWGGEDDEVAFSI